MDRRARRRFGYYWVLVLALCWFVVFVLMPRLWRWEARMKAQIDREEVDRAGQRL